MTAIRSSLQNSFETTLTAEMGPNSLTAEVASLGSLTSPCYICIDMESDSLREYIYFDGSFGAPTFVTTNIANRYLPGSAAGSNLTHAIGAVVRVVPMAQHFEDLHDRIDGISHASLDGLTNDDHEQYALADGTRAFTGVVVGVSPVADADLATKGYVDSEVSGGIPPGIIMPYGAATAPGGYLLCDGDEISRATYNDLFLVIGTTFGVGDGSTTFELPDLQGRFPLGLAAADTGSTLGGTGGSIDPTIDIAHTHGLGAHVHDIGHGHTDTLTTSSTGSHTHAMPSHTHTTSIDHNHGSFTSGAGSAHTHTGPSHTHSAGNTGGPSSTIVRPSGAGTAVASSTHTHDAPTTGSSGTGATSSESSHTHTVDVPNYNVANVTSSSVDPGDAQANGLHSHTVNGSVTDHAGDSGSASGTSDSGLSDDFDVPNAPFLAVQYVIKT